MARALGWAAFSAVALSGTIYWGYVLYMPGIVWQEPAPRIARIVASSHPPITVALITLLGAAALSLALAALGSGRRSTTRLSWAMGWFAAHLLVVLTAMMMTSPMRDIDELRQLQGGMLRTRHNYATAYAAGLFLWQAFSSAAFAILALIALPLLRARERAGVVPSLRLLAAVLLVLAPFSFAFEGVGWDESIVLAASPLWLTAEIVAAREERHVP